MATVESKIPHRSMHKRDLDPVVLGDLGFLAGGCIGGCVFISTCLWIEKNIVDGMFDPDAAYVAHGQSTIIFLPLAALIGAVNGFVVGASFARVWEIAFLALGFITVVNGFLLWYSVDLFVDFFQTQTNEYQTLHRGVVSFYGAFAITFAVGLVAAVLATSLRIFRWIASRKTKTIAV